MRDRANHSMLERTRGDGAMRMRADGAMLACADGTMLESFLGAKLEVVDTVVLVVVMPASIVDDPDEAALYAFGFESRFRCSVLLVTFDGGARWFGPSWLVRAAAAIPPNAWPLRRYAFAPSTVAPIDRVAAFTRVTEV